MKAERRHELQENSLVRGINHLPELWRKHGTKLSIGILAVVVLVVFILQWRNRQAESRQAIARALTSGRTELERVRSGQTTPRPEVWSFIEQAVAQTLADSSDPAQVAEAKLLRADANLYWALLATIGDPIEAATQPALKVSPNLKAYLEAASKNYQDVASQTSLAPLQWGSARLGQAAVAEFNNDNAAAKKIYDDLTRDHPLAMVKQLAETRKRTLEQAEMRKNPLIGNPRDKAAEKAFADAYAATTRPATQPTTQATTQPATQPSTPAPSTQPASAVPATQPVAAPAVAPATQPTTAPATQPASSTAPATQPATAG